jgi:hypothetical protein
LDELDELEEFVSMLLEFVIVERGLLDKLVVVVTLVPLLVPVWSLVAP